MNSLSILCYALYLIFLSNGYQVFRSNFHKLKSFTFRNSKDISRIGSNSLLLDKTEELIQFTKKWIFLNKNYRSEVSLSNSINSEEILTDLWKSIVISRNILENDITIEDHNIVLCFPNLLIPETSKNEILKKYSNIIHSLKQHFDTNNILFQKYERTLDIQIISTDQLSLYETINLLTIEIKTHKINSENINYDLTDWDNNLDDIKLEHELNYTTNEFNNFPFPTVFDFINEINRPIDFNSKKLNTYNYCVKDLKYDLKKSKSILSNSLP